MSRRIPSSVSLDIRQFLSGYPGRSPSRSSVNLAFYTDKGPAKPSRATITQLQKELAGDYDELESSHSFIQWLFPIKEMGMNYASSPLEEHERVAIIADPAAMERLLTSYRIMLDFYGHVLVSPTTGQVARSPVLAPSPQSWRRRYANLERNGHNYLRITRILKCNSEMGRDHLNAPWILWFLVEQARGDLDDGGLVRSIDGYWRFCIRDDDERDWVVAKIDEVRKGGSWTEEEYAAAVKRREKTGSFAGEDVEVEEGQGAPAESASENGRVSEMEKDMLALDVTGTVEDGDATSSEKPGDEEKL